MRWGKAPRARGLASVADAGRYREDVLRHEGKDLARVAQRENGEFFFYTLGFPEPHNSLAEPWQGRRTWPTPAEAKTACMARVRVLVASGRAA